jgi:hypothetical protein
MTIIKDKPAAAAIKDLLSQSPDALREIVRAVMQEMLQAEMTDALQAEKGERTATRLGYRSGYYTRTLITRHCCVNLGSAIRSGHSRSCPVVSVQAAPLSGRDHPSMRVLVLQVWDQMAYRPPREVLAGSTPASLRRLSQTSITHFPP